MRPGGFALITIEERDLCTRAEIVFLMIFERRSSLRNRRPLVTAPAVIEPCWLLFLRVFWSYGWLSSLGFWDLELSRVYGIFLPVYGLLRGLSSGFRSYIWRCVERHRWGKKFCGYKFSVIKEVGFNVVFLKCCSKMFSMYAWIASSITSSNLISHLNFIATIKVYIVGARIHTYVKNAVVLAVIFKQCV